jgi:hypothetical protein
MGKHSSHSVAGFGWIQSPCGPDDDAKPLPAESVNPRSG